MKIRIDHNNLYLYFQKLQSKGYKKVSTSCQGTTTKTVFVHSVTRKVLVVTYTENGWVGVE